MQKLTKEEKQAWISQLVVTKINSQNISEILELIVESIDQMYELYTELGVPKEVTREAFQKILENQIYQQNSMVLMDISNNNKIVGVRTYIDMTQYDKNPPKEEDFTHKGYFLKCQLIHEIFEPIFHLEFKKNDYEVTPFHFVHPDYANRGLANHMHKLYAIDIYQRGVKKIANAVYNPVALKIQLAVKGGNPQVLNEINLEDRELDGKKAFKKLKKGYLVGMDISEKLLEFYGIDPQGLQKDNNTNIEIQ